MVVDEDSRLQRKTIQVVWETQDKLLVKEGLAPGEQLCVTYVPFAANNAKVKLTTRKSYGFRLYEAIENQPLSQPRSLTRTRIHPQILVRRRKIKPEERQKIKNIAQAIAA
jgi:hypothetical protein